MKSKLTMLIFAAALTFSATAPNAMASGGLGNTPPNHAISNRAKASVGSLTVTKNAVPRGRATAKVSGRAAVPPHTILSGAKNNRF